MPNIFVTCPTNCGNYNLPILPVNQDCFSVEGLENATINSIVFLSKKDNTGATNTLPTALTLPVFTALIDNADITGQKAKYLKLTGSLPAPEKIEVTLPGFKVVTKERRYTLTASTNYLPAETYAFLQSVMCQAFDGYIWFFTDDSVFGGITTDTAIYLSTLDADIILAEGENSSLQGTLIAKFRTKTFPPKADNFGL